MRVKYSTSNEKLSELGVLKKTEFNYFLPVKTLPPLAIDSLTNYYNENKTKNLTEHFGKEINVDLTTSNSGEWVMENDQSIWRLKIHSSKAYSLSFKFRKLYLPEGATLLIYNEEETFMYGPLTNINNNKHGKFSTGPIKGENIIIELVVPQKNKDKLKLEINEIIHGYKNMFLESGGYGTSGSCNINVVCRPAWADESDGVARVIRGTGYGSGALINNVTNDYTPYFLTALHVTGLSSSGTLNSAEIQTLSSMLFQFQYKSSTCNPSSSSGYIEFEGADLISRWDSTDFILLELHDSPFEFKEIAYLGWDRSNSTPTSVVCLHHPSGDVMKYSHDNESPTIEVEDDKYCWFIDDWYEGTTEGGSSGSPLFNEDSRIVGQDYDGDGGDPCDTDKGTYFGSFYKSWLGGGTADSQLKHWLDPNNTGTNTTDLLRSPSLTVPDVICYSGTTVTMQNPPSGNTITWGGTNVSYPNGSTGSSVTVRAASSSISDNGTVTASFTTNGTQYTIEHPIYVGTPYINPSSISFSNGSDAGSYHCTNCFGNTATVTVPCDFDNLDVKLTNLSGSQTISQFTVAGNSAGTVAITMGGSTPSAGQYMFWVRGTNDCGTGSWSKKGVTYQSCGGLLLFSPNPTSGETTVSVEIPSADESNLKSALAETTFEEDAEWELEVYDIMQSLKAKKTKIRGKSTTLNTHSWNEGVYTVRAKYKGEILSGKLVVKR